MGSPTSDYSSHNTPKGNKDTDKGSSNILPRGKFVCFEEEGRDIPIRQGA